MKTGNRFEEFKELSRCEKYWIVPYYWRMYDKWQIVLFENERGRIGKRLISYGYDPSNNSYLLLDWAKGFDNK